MTTRFNKARFHHKTGPKSLFDRVAQKMSGIRKLKLNADHFKMRIKERGIDVDLELFDSSHWELVTAEVRTDNCKFVNSCWKRKFEKDTIWIVIGYGDTIETAFFSSKFGLGPDIVRDGPLFEKVENTNRDLLGE